MNIKHKGRVDNGKLTLYNTASFKENLRLLSGHDVAITVGRHKDERSGNQNRYYWGVVLKLISEETGYFADEVHEFLKRKFLECKDIEVHGESYTVPVSSAKLKTDEFEQYLELVRIWAVEALGIQIPLPNEVTY